MRYFEIIQKYGLEEVWKTYTASTAVNAPYHNTWHTVRMLERCYEAYQYFLNHGVNFPEEYARDLFTAAILHDINHSAGKLKDSENITNALAVVEALGGSLRIQNIIKATEYPYVLKAEDLNLLQQIIRDADLMSTFDLTFFSHCIVGLSAEMGVNIEKMILGEESFIRGIQWNTSWGEEQYAVNSERVFAEISVLKEIYGA